MATIVCRQGLQSCLESQLVEPRALRLKLSSHFSQLPLELAIKSCFFDSNIKQVEEKCSTYDEEQLVAIKRSTTDHSYPVHHDKLHVASSKPDVGGWSFLQALSNGPQYPKLEMEEKEKKTTYIHPLVKRSLSTLSERSLELCTENLGNETGSDVMLEDNINFSSAVVSSPSCSSDVCDSPTRKQRQSRGAKKATARDFPPPLTTISGSESVQVRAHREDGRLVIKAIKAPSTNSLFHAERSNGRLRLCLVKHNPTPSFDYHREEEEEEAAAATDEISDEECSIHTENKQEFENDSNSSCEDEAEEEEEEEDVNGAEMEMKELQRHGRGRCKEGGEHHHHHHQLHQKKGLLNWEPVLVATS